MLMVVVIFVAGEFLLAVVHFDNGEDHVQGQSRYKSL